MGYSSGVKLQGLYAFNGEILNLFVHATHTTRLETNTNTQTLHHTFGGRAHVTCAPASPLERSFAKFWHVACAARKELPGHNGAVVTLMSDKPSADFTK